MFSQANAYLRSPKVSLVLIGLKIAPRATSKLVNLAVQVLQPKRA